MKPLGKILANFSTNHYELVVLITILFMLLTGLFFLQVSMDTDPENTLETDESIRIFHHEKKEYIFLENK